MTTYRGNRPIVDTSAGLQIGIAHTHRQANGDAMTRHVPERDFGLFVGIAWAVGIEIAVVALVVIAWHLWARFA
jgi:hypothetical protein